MARMWITAGSIVEFVFRFTHPAWHPNAGEAIDVSAATVKTVDLVDDDGTAIEGQTWEFVTDGTDGRARWTSTKGLITEAAWKIRFVADGIGIYLPHDWIHFDAKA